MERTEVLLHLMTTADDGPHLDRLLDPAEQVRSAGFVDRTDRARFRVGAVLVRLVATEYEGTDVRIDRTCSQCGAQHGRPRVVGSDLRVSVSHAGPHVLVASAVGRDVGVDVDRIEPSAAQDVGRALLGPDGTWTDLDGLTACWVRAEAVAKATGVPLARSSASGECVVLDLPAPVGYRAALAVTGVAPVTPVSQPRPARWPV